MTNRQTFLNHSCTTKRLWFMAVDPLSKCSYFTIQYAFGVFSTASFFSFPMHKHIIFHCFSVKVFHAGSVTSFPYHPIFTIWKESTTGRAEQLKASFKWLSYYALIVKSLFCLSALSHRPCRYKE